MESEATSTGPIDVAALTKKQQAFLVARPSCGTDADAARRVGVSIGRVYNWKSSDAKFRVAYDTTVTATRQAIANFDASAYIEEKLVPLAVQRQHELLSAPITAESKAADRAIVRDVAKDVLAGRGYLTAKSEHSSLRIDVLVAQFIAEGIEYQPPWALAKQAS